VEYVRPMSCKRRVAKVTGLPWAEGAEKNRRPGSRAPAMSWYGEAWTNALEAVPKVFLSRCHHSRRPAGTRRLEKPTDRPIRWLWLTAKTALLPLPARLPNRERYHTVAQHQHRTSTHVPTNLWQPGQSGNPAGRLRGSRNKLSEAVICALLRDFSKHGEKAIAKVRRTQPAAYLKILALLVPREHKVEHSNPLKELTDEELEAMIEHLKASLEAQAQGAKVVDGKLVDAAALPAPDTRAG